MSFHINDINKYLKDTNSNNSADFIHIDKVGIIVTILVLLLLYILLSQIKT